MNLPNLRDLGGMRVRELAHFKIIMDDEDYHRLAEQGTAQVYPIPPLSRCQESSDLRGDTRRSPRAKN